MSDDDEFSIGDSSPSRHDNGVETFSDHGRGAQSFLVPNQHHDEAVELTDDGSSVAPSPVPSRRFHSPDRSAESPSPSLGTDLNHYDEDGTNSRASPSVDAKGGAVSSEISDLLNYISRYVPQEIDLEVSLEPFIPDYIPAVGDIDAFIKVPRPDDRPDNLGLVVLDEPSGQQTDPTVLDLQLRVLSKQSTAPIVVVRSIDNADKSPKAISAWIANIQDLHRQKPPPTVSYSRMMPEIDDLMQNWPADFESALQQSGWPLPAKTLQMDVTSMTRMICALMDIPVYNSLKESLHLLFTLYIEFKSQAVTA